MSMECEKCMNPTSVYDSRPDKGVIYRRRKCSNCGHRFTTFELTKDALSQLVDAQNQIHTMRSVFGQLRREMFFKDKKPSKQKLLGAINGEAKKI